MFFNHRHEARVIALLQNIEKEIRKMNQAEQDAFGALNTKTDALVSAVTALTTEISTEQKQLADALAANDTAGVLSAAAALSAKLDTGLAAASAALATPPVVPAV